MVIDAPWAEIVSELAHASCGPDQVGGRGSPATLAISIVQMLQNRLALMLPTVLLAEDVEFGYDGTQSSAVIHGMAEAGLAATELLMLQQTTEIDRARMRVGRWISEPVDMGELNIPQGRQNSTVQFNVAINEGPHRIRRGSGGVLTAPISDATAKEIRRGMENHTNKDWGEPIDDVAATWAAKKLQGTANGAEGSLSTILQEMPNPATAAAVVDKYLQGRCLVEAQFIDDSAAPTGSPHQFYKVVQAKSMVRDDQGLNSKEGRGKTDYIVVAGTCEEANQIASRIAEAGPGRYGLVPPPEYSSCNWRQGSGPSIQDKKIRRVTQRRILGPIIDETLTLLPGLSVKIAETISTAERETAVLQRLNVPWIGILQRVQAWVSSLLFASAIYMTSKIRGQAAVMLNRAHRRMFAIVLGTSRVSRQEVSGFRSVWLLGERPWRLSTLVLEESLVEAARGQASAALDNEYPSKPLEASLWRSWQAPGSIFESIEQFRQHLHIPSIREYPRHPQATSKTHIQSYRQKIIRPALEDLVEDDWINSSMQADKNLLFVSRVGGPGEWLRRLVNANPEGSVWHIAKWAALALTQPHVHDTRNDLPWATLESPTMQQKEIMHGILNEANIPCPQDTDVLGWTAGCRAAEVLGVCPWHVLRTYKALCDEMNKNGAARAPEDTQGI